LVQLTSSVQSSHHGVQAAIPARDHDNTTVALLQDAVELVQAGCLDDLDLPRLAQHGKREVDRLPVVRTCVAVGDEQHPVHEWED